MNNLVAYQGEPYLIVSSSALAAFKRCRKSYELGYVHNYEAIAVPGVVTKGADFHRHMEALATGSYDVLAKVQDGDEMAAIAWAYNEYKPVPSGTCVVAVEKPFYIKLIKPAMTAIMDKTVGSARTQLPGVLLRCTFDLVYEAGTPTMYRVMRDYKTFDKFPSMHVDLDFQGGIYTAAGMRIFQTDKVFFEYEFVRRTLPNVVKDKSGGKWREDECYVNVQRVLSKHQADTLWAETQDVARDLVRAYAENRFYRQDLKVGPHGCESCFFRHGCVAEWEQGKLDDQTAAMWYRKRESLTLPEGAAING